MEKWSDKWMYWLLKPLSMLPLRVLFFISDITIYPLIYRVFRYRLNVVRENLANSFPDKTTSELRQLEKQFYRHLCDGFMEMIRVLSMSSEEVLKRMKCVNPEVFLRYEPEGKGVMLLLGHYGNWEYQLAIYLHMVQHGSQLCVGVYRPLKNKAFDYLYQRIRTRFGNNIVPKDSAFRKVIELKRNKISAVYGLVADQTPSRRNIHYWTTFLNQDTPMFSGGERMARQTGFPVVYADVRRLSRGYYQTEYILLSDDPQSEPPDSITERYARAMEQTILRDPAYWLWSHRRWKYKRNTD